MLPDHTKAECGKCLLANQLNLQLYWDKTNEGYYVIGNMWLNFWITSVCMLSVFKGTQDAVYCTANYCYYIIGKRYMGDWWVTTCFCVIKGSHACCSACFDIMEYCTLMHTIIFSCIFLFNIDAWCNVCVYLTQTSYNMHTWFCWALFNTKNYLVY